MFDDDLWQRVDEWLDAALDRPPAERALFLAKECPDPEVREHVARLLARVEESAEVLVPGGAVEGALGEALVDALDGPAAERPGAAQQDRIDGFELLEKIGEGGMGEVWLAEQTVAVRRRVAIKLIRWGMDVEQVVVRFESERQALALMSHPTIAQVYGGGATAGGRPYFVMEYVAGLPITDYCDRHRLSLEERLRLFVSVCEGVQHAHQKGIIHRDIKPSNVMVAEEDGRPLPKIIDFGVARAVEQRLTEKTVFTAFGQLIGTPEYMSPEQAAGTGDIDTRSDIYSLGVLLYELLVGARPFDAEELRAAGFEALLAAIRQREPARPSQRLSTLGEHGVEVAASRRTDPGRLGRHLRGDLDWIVMKALDKERSRRYGSPLDLAADIRRHLEHQPVVAGPPSAGYRLRKVVRRHRFAAAAAAAVLATLSAGVTASTWQAIRASRAEQAALEEARTARSVADFVVGLFELSDPGVVRGDELTAREILDRGRRKLERELADDPLVRARLLQVVGDIYRNLGVFDESLALLTTTLEQREQLLLPGDPAVEEALVSLGRLHIARQDWAAAEPLLQRALALAEARHGPGHHGTARPLRLLAEVARESGRRDDAARLYRAARDASAGGGGEGSDEVHANAVAGLAILASEQGRFADAASLFEQAAALLEAVHGPDHPDRANTLANLGSTLSRLGRNDDAVGHLREAVAVQERVFGPDHPLVAQDLALLGGVYGRMGKLDQAEEIFLRTAAIRAGYFGAESVKVVGDYKNLGLIALLRGRLADAERYLSQTLAIEQRELGDRHLRTAWTHSTLGGLYRRQARWDDAERAYRLAIDLYEELVGPKSPEIPRALTGLGQVALGRGRPAEAERVLRRALALREQEFGPEHPELSATLEVLGATALALGRHDEAEAMLERAAEITRNGWSEDHPALAPILFHLADLHRARGNLDAAERTAREALAIAETAHGAESCDAADGWYRLGLVASDRERPNEAREALARALSIRRALLGPDHPDARATAAALRAVGP